MPVRSLSLPRYIYITDSQRVPDLQSRITALPRNAAVLIRDYTHPKRLEYARHIVKQCRKHRVTVLVANDVGLARAVQADGLHLPEYMHSRIATIHRQHPFWLITTSAHSWPALCGAMQTGANAVLLSPLFPTSSHPGKPPIPEMVRNRWLRHCSLPVYALGGVSAGTSKKLKSLPLVGMAGISLWHQNVNEYPVLFAQHAKKKPV